MHPPVPDEPTAHAGPDGDAAPARVVLYGRAGCHLCDEARVLVQAVCAESGTGWREVDVDSADAPALPGGEPVREAYGDLVPVVEVDGVRQGYWRIDADRLRRVLAAGPRTT